MNIAQPIQYGQYGHQMVPVLPPVGQQRIKIPTPNVSPGLPQLFVPKVPPVPHVSPPQLKVTDITGPVDVIIKDQLRTTNEIITNLIAEQRTSNEIITNVLEELRIMREDRQLLVGMLETQREHTVTMREEIIRQNGEIIRQKDEIKQLIEENHMKTIQIITEERAIHVQEQNALLGHHTQDITQIIQQINQHTDHMQNQYLQIQHIMERREHEKEQKHLRDITELQTHYQETHHAQLIEQQRLQRDMEQQRERQEINMTAYTIGYLVITPELVNTMDEIDIKKVQGRLSKNITTYQQKYPIEKSEQIRIMKENQAIIKGIQEDKRLAKMGVGMIQLQIN